MKNILMIPFKVVPMIILQHIAFSKKTSSPVVKKVILNAHITKGYKFSE